MQQPPVAVKRGLLRIRTPDAVEFAVSPQVGQAVLACPTREALAIERNGSAHFPRRAEIAGRHQEFCISVLSRSGKTDPLLGKQNRP
jgi:hypothetical protein